MKKRLTINLCKSFFFLLFSISASAEPFTEISLQNLLKKNPQTDLPVQSIQELVPLLPRELRQNYTFVYDSRSPFHDSISPLYPRVILFTNDARLVLTFTGDPNKPGFDYLESMTFSDKTAEFKFELHTLPAALQRGEKPTALARDCKHCHGDDPRPINDSYPLWPGFYGSIQDTFPSQSAVGRKEHSNYVQFLQSNAKKGVYEKLFYSKDSPVPPYANPANYVPTKIEGNLDDFRFLPNTRFGMALTELNRKRIYRKLAKSLEFRKRQKEFLAELLDCPKGMRKNPDLTGIEKALQLENTNRMKRQGVDLTNPAEKINDMQELLFARELEQVDWVARAAKVSREDWSMAMEANSLSFFDGILSGIYNQKSYYMKEDLIFEMLKNISELEPQKFKQYFRTNAVYAWLAYPFGH
jgi:hypothetical protein